MKNPPTENIDFAEFIAKYIVLLDEYGMFDDPETTLTTTSDLLAFFVQMAIDHTDLTPDKIREAVTTLPTCLMN